MLATEPSVSIFGEPLTTTQLAKLAAEAGQRRCCAAGQRLILADFGSYAGVGKCPILGILDITQNSSHYRHL